MDSARFSYVYANEAPHHVKNYCARCSRHVVEHDDRGPILRCREFGLSSPILQPYFTSFVLAEGAHG